MPKIRSGQTTLTSATLVGRLRNVDDELAWREFDRRYRGLIVGFLRSSGLQLSDAEDLAQTVVSKLVSGLRSFAYTRENGGFRAYLFRCSRNTLHDYFLRQAHSARSVSLREVHDEASGGTSDAAWDLFEREWVDHHYRIAVRRFRDSASDRALDILEATLAGRSTRSIAEELGMTEPAVHKAQQRIRDELRGLIAEQLRDEEDPGV
ncbi:MAG: sigma-70 family RNA polymerase sigma factor [Phycisphaeraceae bacterium]|nr:sigma-70 family RNA polymerase sigma factor [Phycisphaeraceae bacterium]MCW5768406.1 sigma-70 family RNA polymerase sigma factor [Phycisphaeraceae bacterium]